MPILTRQSVAPRGRSMATVCVAITLMMMQGPAVMAAPEAGSGAASPSPSVVSSTDRLAAPGEPHDTQAVLDYWTPERMETARPPTLPGSPQGDAMTLPAEAGEPEQPQTVTANDHETRLLTDAEVLAHPHSSIGKVFFNLRGFDFVCSASAVTTGGRWGEGPGQLIVTAGHCLSDGGGTFASSLLFVPGYTDGVAPFGRWVAWKVFTTNAWHFGSGRGYSRDVAFARVIGTEEYADTRLDEVVDTLDIAFTQPYPLDRLHVGVQPRTGTSYASFGYGVDIWGGERQVRTRSQVVRLDSTFSPPPMGTPSTHTGGASGGPWLYNYAPDANGGGLNVINSVNSYVYRGEDVIHGPQFDDQIHQLWTYANLPGIAIIDAEVDEGDAGTTEAVFTVSLDAAGAEVVSVDYATADVDAEAGSDYLATAGTLTFQPGETSQEVVVDVVGDARGEDYEDFTVQLDTPGNAFVRDAIGVGTILDDEPELEIGPASVVEGDEGTTTAVFPVTLDQPSDLTVTVDYLTGDDTAHAPDDYTATSGTLTFSPGETTQNVLVDVTGDILEEGDETFTVQLTNPSDAVVLDGAAGVGTIVDDDDPAPPVGGGSRVPPPPQAEGSVSQFAPAGGTVSGEDETGGASVTTPNSGTVTILVRQTDETAPDGFGYLPVAMDISAPDARAENPLVLDFRLAAASVPDGVGVEDIVVFRNGLPLEDCPAATTGGPCTSERSIDPETGDVRLRVLTPAASTWTFGVAEASSVLDAVRLRADSNVTAAIAWSQFGFEEGGAATVLLGRDDVFADSLASGPVQGVAGAPLLLTSGDALDERTAEEISRLGPRTVVILGGTAAISVPVEEDLIGLGYEVERVSGDERLSTATAVAERFFAEATSAILARGTGDADDPTRAFADSLGAGAWGASTGQPVLLSDPDGLSVATATYLASSSITSVTIVGGVAAISEQVTDDLTALGISVERISGADRFSTAALLAARDDLEDPERVLLVNGSGVDAWASGFAAASQGADAPLLLADGPRVPDGTLDVLGGLDGPLLTCGPYVTASACDGALAAVGTAARP